MGRAPRRRRGSRCRSRCCPGTARTGGTWPGTNWQDWYRAFEAAYLELAARTGDCFVAGLSMGGTIALRTAARHPVAGVAVVNPGLSFYDRRVRIVGLLKYFQRTTMPHPGGQSTASATDDGDYSVTPLAAVHQLSRLFSATLRAASGRPVPCPGLQVRYRRRGAAVVPRTAAQAARVPGPQGGPPPGQRACCHPGR